MSQSEDFRTRKNDKRVFKVTRSTGIFVPGITTTTPLPGGGYSGETKELDDAVVSASKLLKRFGPVEIRFNADRQSGGAFINGKDDGTVGIGVYKDGRVHIVTYENYLKDGVRDSIVAGEGPDFEKYGSGQISRDMPSIKAARDWLVANVDFGKVRRAKKLPDLVRKIRGTGTELKVEGQGINPYASVRRLSGEGERIPISGNAALWKGLWEGTSTATIVKNLSEHLKVDQATAEKIHAEVLKALAERR